MNKNLCILRLFLCSYYGAVGCIWPFLTLHMKLLGLTIEEIAVINLVLPFASATSKPLSGIIADKTGKYKHLLVVTIFLTSSGYTSLLLVPPVDIGGAESITDRSVTFHCASGDNHALWTACPAEQCKTLDVEDTRWTDLTLKNCDYACVTRTSPHVHSARWHTPICYTDNDNSSIGNFSECAMHVQSANSTLLGMTVRTSKIVPTSSGCEFYFSNVQVNGESFSKIHCHQTSLDCDVVCSMYGANEAESTIGTKKSTLTFWMYLVLRCLAEVMLSACFPITDAIVINMTAKYGGHFGQLQLCGVAALGVFSPIAGLLVDHLQLVRGFVDYSPCFYLSNALQVTSILLLIVMPVEIKTVGVAAQSMTRGIITLLSSGRVFLLFIVVLALGMIWGYMETFLYLYMQQMGSSRLLIGLTNLIAVVPSVPILYKSKWILKKCGNANVLILAFFVYSIRSVGYVFMDNPWWALLLESSRALSLYLARTAFTLEANSISPPQLKVTTQALVFLLHFDVGRGLGSLIGGYLMETLGSKTLFQIIAVYAGSFGCAYFSLHHFYVKDKLSKHRSRSSSIQSPAKTTLVQTPDEKMQNGGQLINGHLPLLRDDGDSEYLVDEDIELPELPTKANPRNA